MAFSHDDQGQNQEVPAKTWDKLRHESFQKCLSEA